MESTKKDMASASWVQNLKPWDTLNFLATNRIPRALATQFMGRFSKIRHPLIAKLSIGTWKLFVDDLRLGEARKTHFESMHDCFIRELKPEARPIDQRNHIVTSPCDAVVGAHGRIENDQLLQIKGFPYTLQELLGDSIKGKSAIDLTPYRNGRFVTLRIKSSMYHRFHAPLACAVKRIHYISGDTWNVNPVTLKRIEKLFCKNERAVVELDLPEGQGAITLVPVAAILVASMRFHALAERLHLNYKGKNTLDCDASYAKGEQMGYFEHGSTIVMLCSEDYRFDASIEEGKTIRVGQPLMVHHPGSDQATDPTPNSIYQPSSKAKGRTMTVHTNTTDQEPGAWRAFLNELDELRWDDHRYYHQSRINQSLHFVSSISFMVMYVMLFINPGMAALIGWLVGMCSRQSGHFFFEPRGYDQVNRATHEHKEEIKVGYNLQRKRILHGIWAAIPVILYFDPTLFGTMAAYTDIEGFLYNMSIAWLALGISALLFRTIQLFFIRDIKTGLAWCVKIITDPFHDFKTYMKSPYYLMKGQLMDPMDHV